MKQLIKSKTQRCKDCEEFRELSTAGKKLFFCVGNGEIRSVSPLRRRCGCFTSKFPRQAARNPASGEMLRKLGDLLKVFREWQDLSQDEMGREMQLSQYTVYTLENGLAQDDPAQIEKDILYLLQQLCERCGWNWKVFFKLVLEDVLGYDTGGKR